MVNPRFLVSVQTEKPLRTEATYPRDIESPGAMVLFSGRLRMMTGLPEVSNAPDQLCVMVCPCGKSTATCHALRRVLVGLLITIDAWYPVFQTLTTFRLHVSADKDALLLELEEVELELEGVELEL